MEILDIKTTTITGKGQIAIPQEIRKKKGFGEGMKLVILSFNDRIELRPLKQLNKKLFNALASQKSLAKDWLNPDEEKAWKNL